MSGRRLILMDGTIIENAEAGAADGRLWCYLPQTSLADAYALFSDTAKTEKIVFEYDVGKAEYDGYTDLLCVKKDAYSGEIAVQLMKGADE